MMHGHHIHLVKRSRAGGTLAHPVADPIFDALVAEEVSARLQCRVFEVVAADGAQRKGLQYSWLALASPAANCGIRTYPKHLFLL